MGNQFIRRGDKTYSSRIESDITAPPPAPCLMVGPTIRRVLPVLPEQVQLQRLKVDSLSNSNHSRQTPSDF